MRLVVFGDSHINQNNIEELEEICKEIYFYLNYNTFLICLGDYYDKNRLSAQELEFGTRWANKFRKEVKEFYLLRGNHPLVAKEVNKYQSSIEYLKYLDIKIFDEVVVNKIYFAHKFTDRTNVNLINRDSNFEISLKEIENYKYSLLGHFHSFQELIPKKAYHLGSCIWTSFNEVNDKHKYIAIINKNIKFVKLSSPIPMRDVDNIEELQNTSNKTKVRYIFNSFEQLQKEINEINKIKSKFHSFKVKLNFNQITTSSKESFTNKSFKEYFKEWLNKIDNQEVRKVLEEALKDEEIQN